MTIANYGPSPMTEEDLLHDHRLNPGTMRLSKATIIKLAELERVLKSCYNDPDNWQEIENLINRCYETGDDAFLHDVLERYKRKDEN